MRLFNILLVKQGVIDRKLRTIGGSTFRNAAEAIKLDLHDEPRSRTMLSGSYGQVMSQCLGSDVYVVTLPSNDSRCSRAILLLAASLDAKPLTEDEALALRNETGTHHLVITEAMPTA